MPAPVTRRLQFTCNPRRFTTDALTWGQRCIWDALKRSAPNNQYMDALLLLPIDAEVALASALAAITFAVERHESLRTYYPLDPSTLEPRQVLLDAGEFDVQVIDCAPEEYERAREILPADLLQQPFDLTRGPLFRPAIIAVDGRPRFLALAMSHMVTDGWGTKLMSDELARFLGGTPPSSFTPANWHPQDQAAWEASDAGQRLEQRSLDLWSANFSSFPRSSFYFPESRAPSSPRYSGAQMHSDVLRVASEKLAVAYGVSPVSIIGAAVATCISYVCGVDFSAVNLFVSNRYTSNTSRSVGNFFQEGLSFMSLPQSARFADIVSAFHGHALATYGFTRFSPQKAVELAALIDAANGTRTTFREVVFNMFSSIGPVESAAAVTDVTEANLMTVRRGQISQRFMSKRNEPRPQKIYLEYKGPNYLFVYADSAFLDYSDTSELLRVVEEILLDAAVKAGDPWSVLGRSKLPTFSRGAEWVRLSNSWVDLHETQSAVDETLVGSTSTVFVGDSPGVGYLELYVADVDGSFDPAQFRDAFMRRMAASPSIYLPSRYKVFSEAPGEPSSKSAWDQLPVVRTGAMS